MDRILVAVFADADRARRGCNTLRDLDAEGVIEIHASGVVVRSLGGTVSILQPPVHGPSGTSTELLARILIGSLGGAAGETKPDLDELAYVGIRPEFLSEVGQRMTAGKSAVIADVWEDWGWPADTRLETTGGVVLRSLRKPTLDLRLEKEAETLKAAAGHLHSVPVRTKNDDEPKNRRSAIEMELKTLQHRATSNLVALTGESDARILALEARLLLARLTARPNFKSRIADARATRKRRHERLNHAIQMTQEALDILRKGGIDGIRRGHVPRRR